MKKALYRIAVAGSTEHTCLCVESLLADPRFEVVWMLTPEPKFIGRQKILTKNPVQLLAEKAKIPAILLKEKIDESVRSEIVKYLPIDFLLVVDFGYIIPKWLLELPKIAPLNVHPSELPRWRGSSPGQFALLYGDRTSAVSIIMMNKTLDAGPIVYQKTFIVEPIWNQTDYYQYSFDMAKKILAEKIVDFAEGKLKAKPQQPDSPTPLARRLTKEDGFLSWPLLYEAMGNPAGDLLTTQPTSNLLLETAVALHSWPQTLINASRALSPWPTLWTIVPTQKGPKRMQILSAAVDLATQHIVLKKIKIEGQSEANWNEVKNVIKE